ncbi:MAG: type II toxin-antitoxin system RelE/ParE family toxin [Planctomycetota bacterium]|jgi:plasmid stabilization system protein ParE
MKLRWMPAAQSALDDIETYLIGQSSAALARAEIERLIDAAEKLPQTPRKGRKLQPENRDDLRVVPVRPYWLYYRICPDAIEILLYWHYRLERPKRLG